MADCVALVVCEKALQDKETEAWSLVNIAEGITALVLGQGVPIESVSFWHFEEHEIGLDFAYQLYWEFTDAVESPEFSGTVDSPSMQFRVRGLFLPKNPGRYKLRGRIKLGDSGWVQGSSYWPVVIDKGNTLDKAPSVSN